MLPLKLASPVKCLALKVKLSCAPKTFLTARHYNGSLLATLKVTYSKVTASLNLLVMPVDIRFVCGLSILPRSLVIVP